MQPAKTETGQCQQKRATGQGIAVECNCRATRSERCLLAREAGRGCQGKSEESATREALTWWSKAATDRLARALRPLAEVEGRDRETESEGMAGWLAGQDRLASLRQVSGCCKVGRGEWLGAGRSGCSGSQQRHRQCDGRGLHSGERRRGPAEQQCRRIEKQRVRGARAFGAAAKGVALGQKYARHP